MSVRSGPKHCSKREIQREYMSEYADRLLGWLNVIGQSKQEHLVLGSETSFCSFSCYRIIKKQSLTRSLS
jgi:hypothetical protein